ncbi:carbohydrate diacid regulator [Virgibacillus natechei]|uniref:Carbohydrate diacid regulator n=1 Tax=Virgibacillus natechei TaxID=1216297 RepID=A0ABS4ILF4_9BACI|nr:sugar diacid recognition domain-containing protein [Virgibacillus natechei]MBP1971246.1 carbohydrate diacid regulator [Virgibacillus natechei]UZD12123.1 helix-turn-helix domain-containing protein [Virgibacillus natechei]
MKVLTKKIANAIVEETSIRLHRNVNIMNTEGIIIATRDTFRIGSFHEGALEVLKSGETRIISADKESWGGTQPGVNLPINFQEEIIGVIGVTGDPAEMGDIGELVKMTTELMIRQEFVVSQMEWKQRTKEMIIEQLMKREPSFNDIDRGLSLLRINFEQPFTTMVIQITERTITNQKLIRKLEETIGDENGIVAFINVNRLIIATSGLEKKEIRRKIESVYALLKKQNVVFRIAYSLPFYKLEEFSQAYLDCDITLKISKHEKEVISFAEIEAKALIYQVDDDITERFSYRVLVNLDENKASTLEAFFVNDLNIQKAADDLYVHRNTFIYRLHKIIEETGYDPRKFRDALILQVALWIWRKGKG